MITQELAAKIATIQKELIAPKNNYNNFGRYAYRNCEDILQAVKPLCDKYKCLVIMDNDLQEIGSRHYVQAKVTIYDLEGDGFVTVTAHAREEESKKGMDDSQVTGASSSYARKYALAGLFCIDNEADSDATNDAVKERKAQQSAQKTQKASINKPATNNATTQQKAPQNAQNAPQHASSVKLLCDYADRHNWSEQNKLSICTAYKVKSLEEMSEAQAKHYIDYVTSKGGNINA